MTKKTKSKRAEKTEKSDATLLVDALGSTELVLSGTYKNDQKFALRLTVEQVESLGIETDPRNALSRKAWLASKPVRRFNT